MSLITNSPLYNISPLDGRYHKKTQLLTNFFSEFGFMKYRVEVEIKYFLFLIDTIKELEEINKPEFKTQILNIWKDFSLSDCELIKEFEFKCNHDVKAVEYFIGNKFSNINLEKYISFIHFGLTSQDINNTSVTVSIKDFIYTHYIHNINMIIDQLNEMADNWKKIVMLSRTHGQPAVPSTLGKEIKVFSYRLEKQLLNLQSIEFYGKFGGAVGNLNAHFLAYPDIDWDFKLGNFLHNDLGLTREKFTTQIDNYENLSVIFDNVRRINTILIDMNRDIWQYISMDYLSQSFNKDEVGSSTMPQKINPINFENSEGNLLLANTLLDFMSNKLPVSRLQRDLTDSTILRNLGSIFGYCEIAYLNIMSGLSKISPNIPKLEQDLNDNVSIITEGVQVILRKNGVKNAYEIVKDMSRGNKNLSIKEYQTFINSLDCIDTETKQLLLYLTPVTYVGNATKI